MVKSIKVSDEAHKKLFLMKAKEGNKRTIEKIIDDLLFVKKIKEAVNNNMKGGSTK
jgi:hypothetical protein